MTASPSTASNGHTNPRPAPEHTHGMARVQEAEGWHLASVARDAVGEAERLCSDIMHTASAVYTRESGPAAFTDPELIAKAEEATLCMATAITYLTALFDRPQGD